MEIEKNELISAEIIDLKGGEILLIPNGVKTIGEEALIPLKDRVKTVLIPGTVTTIKRRAFAGTGVTVVELPESVVTIEDDAFAGCENLFEIILKGDKRDYKTLNPKAVRRTRNLQRVTLNGKVYGVYVDDEKIYLSSAIQEVHFGLYGVRKLWDIFGTQKQSFHAVKKEAFGNGETVEEAVEKCRLAYIEKHGLETVWSELTKDDTISAAEFKEITGACNSGMQKFLEAHGMTLETRMKVEDIIGMIRTEPVFEGALREFAQFVADMYANRIRAAAAERLKKKK